MTRSGPPLTDQTQSHRNNTHSPPIWVAQHTVKDANIIQLLTTEALNMAWYPPENTNIDRGDIISYSKHG